MKASDWIALAQAVALLVTVWFAWRAYKLNREEHREARTEAEREPLRVLLADLVHELKELGAVIEDLVPGIGIQQHGKIVAQQRRLAVALAFLPPDVFNLFRTRDLSTCDINGITRQGIDESTTELLRFFADVEDGKYSIRQARLLAQRQ